MDIQQIACPNCLTANRVPADRISDNPRCGACKSSLISLEPINATDASFDKLVNNTSLPIVVDFWAEWCGPCKMMAPVFAQKTRDLSGEMLFLKVDTESNPGLAARFAIRSIPTLAIFKDGKEISRQAGALPPGPFGQWLNQFKN